MNNIESFLNELCDAASVETLKLFRCPMDIVNKDEVAGLADGFDPVTLADKAAEIAIRNIITKRYPDHGILGEEYGEENSGAKYCWIIDPIDGSSNALSLFPYYGTSVAKVNAQGILDAAMVCNLANNDIFLTTVADGIQQGKYGTGQAGA